MVAHMNLSPELKAALDAAKQAALIARSLYQHNLEVRIKADKSPVTEADVRCEIAIREMAARTPVPIVFPLSNPTSRTEAVPADILAWSDGRALVATGSPFAPVEAGGRTRVIAQANNLYTFPGLGLGTIAARARTVTDPMLLAAASTLAALVPGSRLDEGALYPPLAGLRQISRAIAIAVAREAQQAGLARMDPGLDAEEAVDATTWTPEYPPPGGPAGLGT